MLKNVTHRSYESVGMVFNTGDNPWTDDFEWLYNMVRVNTQFWQAEGFQLIPDKKKPTD